MKTQLQIYDLLVEILGSNNVYFQPPETVKMKYPCIICTLDDFDDTYADNIKYIKANKYLLTFISKNLDSEVPDKLRDLPNCRLTRHYPADNLHHWVFAVYF